MSEPQLEFYDPSALMRGQDIRPVLDDTLAVIGAHLDVPDHIVHECRTVLSGDEHERAQRFRYEHDRTRYIVSHGVLRHVLGTYCGQDPAALRFHTGGAGKPELLDTDAPVYFNLSHAGARAVIALSLQEPVGVDLETEAPDLDPLSIAGHYFYGDEYEAIAQAGNAAAQRQAFYRYWVAKEAVLKGQGLGLGFPLDKFEIRFHTDGTAIAESFDPQQLAPGWRITMLRCDPAWYAAVAYRPDLQTK